ncbi:MULTISPECIES: hypothetical protein [Nostoc]|uniref:Uncharacterized protein n=1 Tax=Nostoc paludosum FACHB-159 TaxID=2692908 RepID=A0ABR8KPV9_9NOSO|nr:MULTISPECIES: hypothetical protein [Nostoc]MBD2683557.1 hypothetical protein [Nostoc sp. FACHB-857]MBD2739763.1 hypothetical protein [Nostoc paludosum FACHB-159]
MLVRKSDSSTNVSPFLYEGLAEKPQQSKQPEQPQPLPENNRVRTFRRAGNACEIVAGSCLNSAVIFTFHLLQVHPVGMFLAVGTAHLYFTATATGEGFNNLVTNLMTGCSASLALLCALNEPIGEWNESRISTSTVKTSIESVYKPKTAESSSWMDSAGVAIFLAIVMIFIFCGGKSK